ncbi:class 1b ribonucleoside-diphosphate reductase subunit beta [Bacillus cereus group sp. MYBK249-1]|jgi:ribonucleoside-diphosphate reductase beta chain|uniref:Ribonucleoside-diphosphate reductase subunit beta n=6 Tax=Bacillus cereus group TaxID=86661 RepID=B0YPL3_BACCE|nr:MULTISPECIES: class 1b ribonucleoside-diphosphate reductase subunit beta [Bacillus]MCO4214856.1 class 1b ribonucleoside-diphosphate reductase subunit beta [Bacillus sp. 10017]MEB4838705.1 class 1b ribonucleoside-diphosphate reductase subunit beta [Paenibacillus jamilae]HCF33149.1 class 1b ribonucleoside-diphosphate reductase subunit beta [Bacillus sp. (in: firmicutes)]ABW06040.1 NrdF [Bacillus thuringiensis serovar entomocidus]ABW06085.1 NrdF [Bacillus thuringiensis serovar subtoxicus]
MRAVNWNKKEDDFSLMFWKQNIAQFWTEEEIAVSSDKNTWVQLSKEEQIAYKRVLGGLTLLDTKQGGEGMPLVLVHLENLQAKSVLAFMGAMEEVHAKSYSHIFTTLATEEEIDDIFDWVDNHPLLEKKAGIITSYYRRLLKPEVTKKELYMAMVASVFLESYLFYSGFFYPLYLAGQGKLTASGEIINLIIRDESIHGVFVGILAQQIFAELSAEEQQEVQKETQDLLMELYEIEMAYTEEIYTSIGLVEDVNRFVRYNANKGLMNLGLEPKFEEEEINPIVLNGLRTDTKNHDFFSVKGNGYVKATNVEKLADDDFVFNF